MFVWDDDMWWEQDNSTNPGIADERELNASLRELYESVMNDLDNLEVTNA
jgi:hypothetical protein